MTDYEALTGYGHSSAKAHEILLDAKRKDFHAVEWVKAIREIMEARQKT